ncbi:hypothetical protein [Desulfosediminicola ganghwensis]|uniref:hypothetical protein n=1 Tax=Desulfosediminicola ganghwensis TaxID=2569540 RepID=UPI0010AD2D9B|nr:hypothetical protein [Desulfosediminicola ganghwensis]
MFIISRQRIHEVVNTILYIAFSCIFLITCLVKPLSATAIADDKNGKVDVENEVTDKSAKRYQPVESKESKSGSGKTKWIVLGGAAAIGLGALAIGAGGSSSSDDGGGGGGTSSQSECEDGLIGPSLAGQWQGVLDLKNYGSQSVSATITHCGERITIRTSTTLPYGQNFTGRVSSGGSIILKEGVTYEIWSTPLGPATSNSLRVYDYVNNQTQLDALKLAR